MKLHSRSLLVTKNTAQNHWAIESIPLFLPFITQTYLYFASFRIAGDDEWPQTSAPDRSFSSFWSTLSAFSLRVKNIHTPSYCRILTWHSIGIWHSNGDDIHRRNSACAPNSVVRYFNVCGEFGALKHCLCKYGNDGHPNARWWLRILSHFSLIAIMR